jgi:amino acid adenylation domain-containing protein
MHTDLTTVKLLSSLRCRDIELKIENDRLILNAPRGVMTPVLMEELSRRKSEIMQFLADSATAVGSRQPPLQAMPREGALSVSFSQRRLWFLSQLEPDSTAYVIYGAIRLQGRLNVEALQRSLNEIYRRHEALRTTFQEKDGRPQQIISPPAAVELPLADLQPLPPDEREAAAQSLISGVARKPFDLARGPLLRMKLLRLGQQEHVFALAMHHIISDGWSQGVFLRELEALYGAFCAGQPSPLPELPVQYADYAIWQQQWLQGAVLERQLAYWKKQLGGELGLLRLPADRPRPTIQTYRGAIQLFGLSGVLAAQLKQLSRSRGATLFMTLLAAFKVLLYRYSGQTDFAVGSPIANRNRPEIENLIGFFVNTLVLRADLAGDPSFRQLLAQVRQITLEAYDHQDLPFEKLVEELQPARDLSYSPLFQVMFVWQNMERKPVELPDLTWTPMAAPTHASMFDLTLYMWEHPEGLSGVFEYNTDLFDAATIEKMAGHFQTLLEGIVADPERRLSQLPLLTAAENHQLTVQWNDTAADYPAHRCLHEVFAEQAARTPDRVAVAFGDAQLSYDELNRRANQLAHHLQALGVSTATRVAVCVERSPEMVVGLLGILKAGAAYVPLDSSYPHERLSFMLEDARVAVLLTTARILAKFPDYAGAAVCLDKDRDVIAKRSAAAPASGVAPEHAAYIIYTSGSTGTPKGVVGRHRASVNRFNWMWRKFPFEENEVCCQKTTLSFVDSIWEIFGPLLKGIKNVIISDDDVKDPFKLVETLASNDVTRIVLVPSLLRVILDAHPDIEARLPKLKIWISSGETLSLELARRFQELLPTRRLLNLYGSSEVAADVTFFDTAQLNAGHVRVPIGRPIDNSRIYILDACQNPVPVGVTGEIYVGGANLAGGYFERPDLTAERFVRHAVGGEAGELLFRTGDLGRYLADGNIDYVGRNDHQVNLRGFRIELGEIEAALRRHAAVRAAAAAVNESANGDQSLVAYVVFQKGRQAGIQTLKRFLQEKLPHYMVPTIIIELEAMPLTPSGKINRLRLPSPDGRRPELVEALEIPKDELAIKLAHIWKKVLGVKSIGIRDNFFELGGHSLLAAQLFARIENELQVTLPLATLFQAPTIELLTEKLKSRSWKASWSSLVPVQPGGTRVPLFLVHGAEGNVLLYRELSKYLGEDQPVYGLQAQGLDGKSDFITSVEDMAEHYIREVCSLLPEGPFQLGGYCLGGLVAFEMARRLQAAGHKIGLLAILESYNLHRARNLPGYFRMFHRIQNLQFHLENLLLLDLNEKIRFFSKKTAIEYQRFKVRTGRTESRKLKTIGSKPNLNYRHLPVVEANHRAGLQYCPGTYAGRITLFRPQKFFAGGNDPLFGWGELATGGVDVRRLPFNPRAMLVEPFVRTLAGELRACLNGGDA